MTPIKLKMQAFGAYIEPVTLDFSNGLRGEKIFLINGATGAGKTTILDAISYALYGETSGKARDGKDMRSKGVPDDVKTEVDFTFALGDKIYEVHREINYSSKRKENKYQTRAALYRDGDLIETKDRAVKNIITGLLGFDAEQFRQVVLLPQGEFKKFLSADSDERQKVLNVLFDSAPYKKIEEALAERAKNFSAEVKALADKKEAYETQLGEADSNLLAELEEKFSFAQKKSSELKKSSDAAQKILSDGKNLAEKFADFKTLTAARDKAKENLDAAEKILAAAQEEYKIREAEETQREELKRRNDKLIDTKKALGEFSALKKKLSDAEKDLQTAQKNFELYDGREKEYVELRDKLEADKIPFVGADVAFEKAAQILEKAKERAKLSADISRREKTLAMEEEKFSFVEKNFNAAQIELERLQIVDNAARLASKLKAGEPCPVCGSLEHPAITQAAIPTVAEFQAAEKNLERLTKEKTQAEKTVAKIKGELAEKKNHLEDYAGIPDVSTAQKNFDTAAGNKDTLATYQQRIEKGNNLIKKNKIELDKASAAKNSAEILAAKLAEGVNNFQRDIDEIYLTNPAALDADLNAAQKKFDSLDVAWQAAQKNFHDAKETKSARAATLQSVQENFDNLQAFLAGKTVPDLETLEKNSEDLRQQYEAILSEKANLEAKIKSIKEFSAKLAEIKIELAAKEKIADMWKRLSDVANATGKGESDLKISFQRYFLSTMFNDVVNEANNRLKKMSNGRYLFQMKDAGKTKAKAAGLNLEIFDEQSGALRPVETLSGGESFLASLSLALGLASVVRNKVGGIKLDTIFIDEGFGSLDSETLDFAISTIIEQSGGRLVGIISHVEELKNQMPVRLEVKKGKTGSTAEFIS